MTDIVDRLRRLYVEQGTNYVQEAADEIERLRAERDSFHMQYRIKCDEETKALEIEIERLRNLIEEAFKDGFLAPPTYNDTLLNTADEAWEDAKIGYMKKALR